MLTGDRGGVERSPRADLFSPRAPCRAGEQPSLPRLDHLLRLRPARPICMSRQQTSLSSFLASLVRRRHATLSAHNIPHCDATTSSWSSFFISIGRTNILPSCPSTVDVTPAAGDVRADPDTRALTCLGTGRGRITSYCCKKPHAFYRARTERLLRNHSIQWDPGVPERAHTAEGAKPNRWRPTTATRCTISRSRAATRGPT